MRRRSSNSSGYSFKRPDRGKPILSPLSPITVLMRVYITSYTISFSPSHSPYFGQVGWFLFFASEKIPSVIERYQKEIIRVLGVLESVLSQKQWLVGDKCSVADLSFITYAFLLDSYGVRVL